MKYQTALRNLEFHSFHGLYEEEKLLGAVFLVDITVSMHTDDEKIIVSIDDACNYATIFNLVKEQMETREDLIETVAQKIYHKLAAAFKQADAIEVTIHKPNPAGLFKSGTASVTFSGNH